MAEPTPEELSRAVAEELNDYLDYGPLDTKEMEQFDTGDAWCIRTISDVLIAFANDPTRALDRLRRMKVGHLVFLPPDQDTEPDGET